MDYSRTNKNKDLYKVLNNDIESQISSHDLEKIANRLNQIDNKNFSEMSNNDISRESSHSRKPSYFSNFDNEPENQKADNIYLEDIINEVNQYNIRKGNKTLDSTSTEILKNLLNKDTNDSSDKTIIYNEKIVNDDLKEEINNLFKNSDDLTRLSELNKLEEDNINSEILDKTLTIQKKIDEYDTRIVSFSNKLNKFNKTINVSLFFIFIIFCIFVGTILFIILKTRNII